MAALAALAALTSPGQVLAILAEPGPLPVPATLEAGTEATCRNPECGKTRARLASGRLEGACRLCRPCYDRWYRAGRPSRVPPPGPVGGDQGAAQRRAEYASLRDQGLTPAWAGRRLWVSSCTARRYELAYQAQREAAT
jgi:hypothetical protein